MGYEQARGIIPWQEGDELSEETIARIRGRGQPEMMKLLGWLDKILKECEGGRNYISAGAYQSVMKYIEREFDCKLPEEEKDELD